MAVRNQRNLHNDSSGAFDIKEEEMKEKLKQREKGKVKVKKWSHNSTNIADTKRTFGSIVMQSELFDGLNQNHRSKK